MKNSDLLTIITHHFTNKLTKQEKAALANWLDASPQNQQHFSEFEKIWQSSNPEEPDDFPDFAQNWLELQKRLGLDDQMKARILPIKASNPPHKWQHHWTRRASVAAAVVLLIFAGSYYLYNNQTGQRWLQAQTQNAQQLEVSLPDGSIVRLNNGSDIQYPETFPDSERVVLLSGEAFFDVVPNEKPFIVKTENALIRVLGTKFNIWTRMQNTRLIVNQGKVAFNNRSSAESQQVVLTANQMSACRNNTVPDTPIAVDSERLLGWLNGRIVFEKTPLAIVVAELQRFYDARIELAEMQLGTRTLTGTFHNKPIESVLNYVCLTLNLKFILEGNHYIISI